MREKGLIGLLLDLAFIESEINQEPIREGSFKDFFDDK